MALIVIGLIIMYLAIGVAIIGWSLGRLNESLDNLEEDDWFTIVMAAILWPVTLLIVGCVAWFNIAYKGGKNGHQHVVGDSADKSDSDS